MIKGILEGISPRGLVVPRKLFSRISHFRLPVDDL
jgi:hypothetical protein